MEKLSVKQQLRKERPRNWVALAVLVVAFLMLPGVVAYGDYTINIAMAVLFFVVASAVVVLEIRDSRREQKIEGVQ